VVFLAGVLGAGGIEAVARSGAAFLGTPVFGAD
jgi:hypothetical protein